MFLTSNSKQARIAILKYPLLIIPFLHLFALLLNPNQPLLLKSTKSPRIEVMRFKALHILMGVTPFLFLLVLVLVQDEGVKRIC